MLEMLLEALAEIFGIETRPPQKRRREGDGRDAPRRSSARRTPAREEAGPAARTPAEPEDEVLTLGELFGKFFGMETTGKKRPPPPEDEPAEPEVPAPPPPARAAGRRGGRKSRPAGDGTIAAAPVYAPPPPVRPSAPASDAEPETPASQLAARLRGNPDAAREAFIYAEIFGRPVGER